MPWHFPRLYKFIFPPKVYVCTVPYPHEHTTLPLFLWVWQIYTTLGLICISLTINEVEHLFINLLAVWAASSMRCLSISSAHFSFWLSFCLLCSLGTNLCYMFYIPPSNLWLVFSLQCLLITRSFSILLQLNLSIFSSSINSFKNFFFDPKSQRYSSLLLMSSKNLLVNHM